MTQGLEILPGKIVFDTLFVDYRIMVATAIISVILFLIGIYMQLDKWGRGIPEGAKEPLGAIGALKMIINKTFEKGFGFAVQTVVLDVFFQRRTFRRRKTEWLMHIFIFWGWFGLFILTVVAALAEFYSPFATGDHTFFAKTWLALEGLNNLFGIMLVAGIIVAIVRRLAFSDVPAARFASVDWISIVGIAIVVGTGFLAQDIRIGAGVAERLLEYPGFFNNGIVLFHEVFTLLFCVAYLPFSKLFHVFVTPLAILINKGGYEANP